ncbi:FAD-dependent oxidoreductase [Microbacterium sp. Se63.02b]|uniref:FAD-dependent oxidoreductase n=1 Tax=Microbacterium sp. Se63.02b TaxID=2709304 RepID=UPI00237A1817|nr:FAD-dependent oxidoreductase [Microbacterium sp. Se63.02b]
MTTTSSALNGSRRRGDLARAAEETVDVLVIGGGITGAGVALDAAARGLSVTLIDAEDLSFGTSRFSSKLVHGGLRYLATGDVATARESAHERHLHDHHRPAPDPSARTAAPVQRRHHAPPAHGRRSRHGAR